MKGPQVDERNFLLRVEPRKKVNKRCLQAQQLVFMGDVMGEIHTTIKLTNQSDSKQAFKVKCTRNDLFRIRPSIGILDYKQSIFIAVEYRKVSFFLAVAIKRAVNPSSVPTDDEELRNDENDSTELNGICNVPCQNNQVPESDRHHFGIYHIPAPEGCTAAGAWAEHYGPPQGELRLKLPLQNMERQRARKVKVESSLKERNFQLTIEPSDKLVFTGDVTGEIRLSMKLTNNSDSRQAFKVKCTRNDLFRIRPATGILEYGKSTYITVTYRCPQKNQVPESGRHHFGIYHIPAPEGATCASVWAEHYGPPQGELRMKVFFENAQSMSSKNDNKENIKETSQSSSTA
uniref:Major sperm protein n=1 Tax=Ascaris lumbricoides TaxID=6252 RepID=A0A9J2Q6C6_ASCLU